MEKRRSFQVMILLFVAGFFVLSMELIPYLARLRYHAEGMGWRHHPAVFVFVMVGFVGFLLSMVRFYEVSVGAVRFSPMLVMGMLLLPLYQFIMLPILLLLRYRMGPIVLYIAIMDLLIIGILRLSALILFQRKHAHHF